MEKNRRESKGILRKGEGDHDQRRTSIQWDEATIEEHDKERGKVPKINEAKTPYHHPNENEEVSDEEKDNQMRDEATKKSVSKHEELDTNQLTAKLTELSNKQDMHDEGHDDPEKEKQHKEFLERRKKHYDEAKMLKMLRQKPNFADEEEG
eukprot:TRINITY_DN6094_c0_g2_i1.p1 TRINITY_DN6094_c0_g2~~TRINITY_DN6094_c0_g2_i1.p1  ORF type:complete len:151 (+),score=47.12 TRINITY_DN6094_c0_g2_i1:536-988(+)